MVHFDTVIDIGRLDAQDARDVAAALTQARASAELSAGAKQIFGSLDALVAKISGAIANDHSRPACRRSA